MSFLYPPILALLYIDTFAISIDLGGRSAFDVAFCLNVLDRCKDPMRLLSQMRALLPERGWLVVSVVVPTLQVSKENVHQTVLVVPGACWRYKQLLTSHEDACAKKTPFALLTWSV